jgi:hypothetical protein
MANLQHNVSHAVPTYDARHLLLLLNNELIPDAIAKRIDRMFGYPHRSRLQVADHLNVATYYGGGYYYYGWVGLFILFAVVLIIPGIAKIRIIQESKYHITFLGVLCSLYLFLVFDNSFVFTGFSFQLFYPVLFSFIERTSGKQNII